MPASHKTIASLARFGRTLTEQTGQAVIEYAIVVGLVSAVIIVTLATAADGWVSTLATTATNAITG